MTQSNIKQDANAFSTASLIFGILTIVSFWTILIPLFTAGFGIGFAFLSRGSKRMNGAAKGGVITSVIGIVLMILEVIVVCLLMFNLVMNLFGNLTGAASGYFPPVL